MLGERGRLRQAVLTLAAARTAWGAGGSLGQLPNVPGAGTDVLKKNNNT